MEVRLYGSPASPAKPGHRTAGSGLRPLYLVMQLHDAVGKRLDAEQAQRHVPMPRHEEGNAFPDEDRHDGDDELVDGALVQEGPDDLASAHHPDVLACLRADALGKGPDRLGDELDA